MAGYSPVNNILVLKGDMPLLQKAYQDERISKMLEVVSTDGQPFFTKDMDEVDLTIGELWCYYETNGEPHEEVPTLIKELYPKLRVFFSSIDYDEWCFAYYKEFGMGGVDPEYNYDTRDEEKIEKIFEEFIRK